jgi:hypothetical protein
MFGFAGRWRLARAAGKARAVLFSMSFGGSSETQIPFGNDKPRKDDKQRKGMTSDGMTSEGGMKIEDGMTKERA